MSESPVRVLIVEDSPTVRHRLRSALTADPGIAVVAEAEDGVTAVELCRRLRPHVVTMDVVLPGISGLEATAQIMAQAPTPILVVSAAERDEVFTTYDALAAGAVEVMEKPRGDATDDQWGERLCATVKLLARVPVVTRHQRDVRTEPVVATPADPTPTGRAGTIDVVALGASTGGPGAVVDLLQALPATFTVPILLVQHIPHDPFVYAYADWLSGRAGRPVSYARGGDPVGSLAGQVLMAPPDRHMIIGNGTVWLTRDPPRHSCRPSVDSLFESVAAGYGRHAAACLLSGMGRDGASGLLTIRQANGRTFAQDEASCVVFGMPKAAAELGAVEFSLPPAEIGRRLCALAGVANPTGGRWRTQS